MSNLNNIIKQGSINKIGGFFKHKQKNQFLILTQNHLKYYNRKNSKKPKISLNLNSVSYIKQLDNCSFEISSDGNKISMKTKDNLDCEDWITKILLAISYQTSSNSPQKNSLRSSLPVLESPQNNNSNKSTYFPPSKSELLNQKKDFFFKIDTQLFAFSFVDLEIKSFIKEYENIFISNQVEMTKNLEMEIKKKNIDKSLLLSTKKFELSKQNKLLKLLRQKINESIKSKSSQLKIDKKFNKMQDISLVIKNLSSFNHLFFHSSTWVQNVSSFLAFKELKTLTIISCQLHQIPHEFISLPNLEYLNISQNPITSIPIRSSSPNIILKTLILNNCNIERIGSSISSFPNLENLFLINNNISFVSFHINNLLRLSKLDLSLNLLNDLPTSFKGLSKSLHFLSLSMNLFSTFPNAILDLRSLEYLNFSENILIDLDCFNGANFPFLQYLDFHGNLILQIPISLTQLTNLENLDLRYNWIQNLDEISIKSFSKIEKFLIDENDSNLSLNLNFNISNSNNSNQIYHFVHKKIFSLLDKCLSKYENKKDIDWQETQTQTQKIKSIISDCKNNPNEENRISINGNEFSQLNKEVLNLFDELTDQMKIIELTYFPQIKELTSFSQKFSRLEILRLTHSGLTEIPNNLFLIRKLKHLNLSYNPIVLLPSSISKNIYLEEIELSNCKISKIGSNINELTNLKTLILKNNFISKIPKSFKNFINITTLDLSGNQLFKFDIDISSFHLLSLLYLSNNYISYFPFCSKDHFNLKLLDLSNNFIQQFDFSILCKLHDLQFLKLSKNCIENIDFVCHQEKKLNLVEFDLSHNLLKSFPIQICFFLTKFCIIRIEENQIDENFVSIISNFEKRNQFMMFLNENKKKKK
ncbi:leucine-rich repeat-containing protein [Anaeramoeba ignava]|uniref:Leucine-rich repeat-containing protein n=1 Tax=Anaeramoeba ignava TaxID=1746090 RepID=A0A9Q0LY08_ANAIG|nr:leucine-rich repeat-containing protein [Anaeramoeba ignava]